MQLAYQQRQAVLSEFQSSPGQKAGCNRHSWVIRPGHPGFNPHPARRPDATSRASISVSALSPFQSSPGQKAGCNLLPGTVCDIRGTVSILTRPEGRMQRPDSVQRHAVGPVSILTRPEGWMQRSSFNPAIPPSRVSILTPARRPDATRPGRRCTWRCPGFNPHPARRPDATSRQGRPASTQLRFNPHPARRPDATSRQGRPASTQLRFNPHPARRPDATPPISRVGLSST